MGVVLAVEECALQEFILRRVIVYWFERHKRIYICVKHFTQLGNIHGDVLNLFGFRLRLRRFLDGRFEYLFSEQHTSPSLLEKIVVLILTQLSGFVKFPRENKAIIICAKLTIICRFVTIFYKTIAIFEKYDIINLRANKRSKYDF